MKFKIQKSKVKSRGFVLPFAVLLAGILLSIGLAIFSITLKELILSSAGRESQFAFFAADAGAECALYWDLRHPGFETGIFDIYQAGTSIAPITASIGFDVVSQKAAQGVNTTSYSHTVGADNHRILIVGTEIEDSGDQSSDCNISGVTYGETPLTQITSTKVSSNGTSMCVSEWYFLNPPSGSANVTITTAGTVSYITSAAISLFNVSQSAPEAYNTNTNTGQSSISTNITTQTNGAWIVDVIGSGNPGSFAANSGQTIRYNIQGESNQGAGGTREIGTAGQTSISWSQSANRLAYIAAAFAPYIEGGSQTDGVPHGAVPQNANAQCGGVDITNPSSGWDPNAGWDSTLPGIVPVITTFDMSFQNNTCASVTVEKGEGTTRIDSRGYNTCDANSTRRVERGLRVSY